MDRTGRERHGDKEREKEMEKEKGQAVERFCLYKVCKAAVLYWGKLLNQITLTCNPRVLPWERTAAAGVRVKTNSTRMEVWRLQTHSMCENDVQVRHNQCLCELGFNWSHLSTHLSNEHIWPYIPRLCSYLYYLSSMISSQVDRSKSISSYLALRWLSKTTSVYAKKHLHHWDNDKDNDMFYPKKEISMYNTFQIYKKSKIFQNFLMTAVNKFYKVVANATCQEILQFLRGPWDIFHRRQRSSSYLLMFIVFKICYI